MSGDRTPDGAARGPGTGSLRHRVRYHFDNLLARGTWVTLVWLGLVTLAAVLTSSLLLAIFGVTFTDGGRSGWLEDFWQSLLRVMDPGTMASDVGWGPRLLALLVTVFGLLVAGTLIGIIAAAVEQRIEGMRRGRSVVIQSDHLVVLGRSDRLPVVVQQLLLTQSGRAGGDAIVVLAQEDPAELDRQVRAAAGDLRGSRVVYRSGDPTSAADLRIARPDHARGVVVLADPAGGDARAVETVLGVQDVLGPDSPVPVTVEVERADTAGHLGLACGPNVHPLVAHQAVARTTAFALRASGLGRVVDALLKVGGCDIHVWEHPDLVGLTFAEVTVRYGLGRPIGIIGTDSGVELLPEPGARLGDGDRLVVLAHTDRTGSVLRDEPARPGPVGPGNGSIRWRPRRERLVVLGWNDFGTRLLSTWGRTVSPGSSVEVVVDANRVGAGDVVVGDLPDDQVVVTMAESPLASVVGRPDLLAGATTVLVLADHSAGPASEADAQTLLALRALQRTRGSGRDEPRFLVELLDADSNRLVGRLGAEDWIASPARTGQLLAQLVEEPLRREVLLTLAADVGPTIDLVPVDELGLDGSVTIADLARACLAGDAVAVGLRRRTDDALLLDPSPDLVTTVGPGDQVIAIVRTGG
ncbi:CASTOR/POLLUX-related putative ion channel [Salsipaludibacter albus]|uniref:CASTOR/POLLUX-related putative ion channel n=1 Tax=Salsipaludibacter albus TaxID=2849650 RepID=UPI001EE3B3C4|nr:hypothetical protein [Salsipaludibacter albus]MBY5161317.1 hypothetical protein [Salsipaludibacter albus]